MNLKEAQEIHENNKMKNEAAIRKQKENAAIIKTASELAGFILAEQIRITILTGLRK